MIWTNGDMALKRNLRAKNAAKKATRVKGSKARGLRAQSEAKLGVGSSIYKKFGVSRWSKVLELAKAKAEAEGFKPRVRVFGSKAQAILET